MDLTDNFDFFNTIEEDEPEVITEPAETAENSAPAPEDIALEESEETPEESPISTYFNYAKESGLFNIPDDFEFDGTPEKLTEAQELSRENNYRAAFESLWERMPDDFKPLLEYGIKGGTDLKAYLDAYAPTKLEDLDTTKPEDQKRIMTQYYQTTSKYSPEKIARFIEKLELTDSLEEEAIDALKDLKENQEASKEAFSKKIDHERQLKAKQELEERNLLETTIKASAFDSVKQNKIKSMFFNESTQNNVTTTPFNHALRNISATPEHLIQLADILLNYNPKTGFDLSRFEAAATTKKVTSLKDIIESKLDPKSKIKQGSTQTKTEDFDFTKFLGDF